MAVVPRTPRRFLDLASSLSGILVLLAVSVVIGGLIGGLVWALTPHPVKASAVVRVVSDSQALASPLEGASASGEVTAAFVSGEVSVLSSDAFAQRVADAVDHQVPPLTVTQIATSDLVTLSTAAADAKTATSVLEQAITTYRAGRQRAAAAALTADLSTTAARLTAIAAEGATASTQAETARLLAHQSDLQAAQGRLDEMVPVVAAPAPAVPKGLGPALLSVLLGAVLAGLAVALAAAVLRLRDQVVRSPSDLTGLGYRVLMPVFDLASEGSWDSSARIILAQVPNVYASTRLVLVAVHEDVRADVVAAVLAKNAPDVASDLPAPVRGLPISWHGDSSHVVTVEATDIGSVLTRRNEPGESVILVAALGRTNRQDVIGASRAVSTAGLTAVGVVLTTNDMTELHEPVRSVGAA